MEPTPPEMPSGSPQAPPPQAPPPQAPPPQAPPPQAPQPAWMQNLTSTAPVAGPAGLFYADLPNRIIAYVIDMILIGIVGAVIGAITGGFMPVVSFDLSGWHYNYVAAIINAVIGAAISAGYFIYMWTAMRGTVGMKVLGMQIGSEKDGSTLSMDQAIRRWLAFGGWISIAQALNPLPLLGILIGLVALGYVIYLLYTTAQSPTKQGFHDKFVGSMVVKAARSVA